MKEKSNNTSQAATGAIVLILLFACNFTGCSTLPTAEQERAQLQARLRTVSIEDGISREEADIIAENYFRRYSPIACGYVARSIDEGKTWIAPTVLGAASLPTREPIRIDKRTGRITWSDGPTIEIRSRCGEASGIPPIDTIAVTGLIDQRSAMIGSEMLGNRLRHGLRI